MSDWARQNPEAFEEGGYDGYVDLLASAEDWARTDPYVPEPTPATPTLTVEPRCVCGAVMAGTGPCVFCKRLIGRCHACRALRPEGREECAECGS